MAKSKVVYSNRNGAISGAVFQGEYEGKTTYSYTVKKQVKKGDNWEDTPFRNKTDLLNEVVTILDLLLNFQPPAEESEAPF